MTSGTISRRDRGEIETHEGKPSAVYLKVSIKHAGTYLQYTNLVSTNVGTPRRATCALYGSGTFPEGAESRRGYVLYLKVSKVEAKVVTELAAHASLRVRAARWRRLPPTPPHRHGLPGFRAGL